MVPLLFHSNTTSLSDTHKIPTPIFTNVVRIAFIVCEARETAQQRRALVTLAEDQRSIPCTHVVAHNSL